MPYHMMVTVSETEKKRVLQDMLDDMPAHSKQALMLKLAKDLRGAMMPEELGQFVMSLRAAMTSKPAVRQRVAKSSVGNWPAGNFAGHYPGNEDDL